MTPRKARRYHALPGLGDKIGVFMRSMISKETNDRWVAEAVAYGKMTKEAKVLRRDRRKPEVEVKKIAAGA